MTQVRMTYTYPIPVLLGIITIFGLVFALLGDGLWDALSWGLLAIPILLLIFCLSCTPK